MITARRKGIWSLTWGNWRRTEASWNRFSSKTDVSSSNTLTFVEVDPGLITSILFTLTRSSCK